MCSRIRVFRNILLFHSCEMGLVFGLCLYWCLAKSGCDVLLGCSVEVVPHLWQVGWRNMSEMRIS